MIRVRSSFSADARGLGRICVLAGVLIAGITGAAQAQYPSAAPPQAPSAEVPTPGTSPTRPHFAIDAAVQPGPKGTPEVRIDYRFPRSELLFERTANGFHASYELRVSFYGDKKKLLAGDEFTRDLRVDHYSETTARGVDIVDQATFQVSPHKYSIQVDLTDLVAERTSTTSIDVDVPAIPVGQIWFTDLTLGTVRDSLGAAGAKPRFDPNPSRRFGDTLPKVGVTGEIVDNRLLGARDSTYRLHYSVLNDVQEEVAKGDTAVDRAGLRTAFLIRPFLGPLDPGTYRLIVELTKPLPSPIGKKKPVPIRREKMFTVEQNGATLGLDSKAAIDVIRYVASDTEIQEMDRLRTADERRTFWEAFWKRRDPTPDTPQNEAMDEFYRRVSYANQHFMAGEPGWKTDMGRVYIMYGQPDEVVRNPIRFEGPPEEIWYYYRERKTYYFVDKDGFGRYELDPTRNTQ